MEELREFFYTRRGLFYTIISGIAYGSLGIFAQLTPSVHILQSSTVRGLFLALLSLIVIFASRSKPVCSKNEFLWILANGSFSTGVQITLFMAYGLAPAGDVNAIVYSSPLFSGILARIFLKETLAWYDALLSLVSITGVFLISKPEFVFGAADDRGETSNSFKGSLWAIGCLILYSIQPVIARKLRQDSTQASILTFTFGIIALSTSAILNSFIGGWTIPLDAKEMFFLIGVGISGFVGAQFLNLSLETEKAIFATLSVTVLTISITYVLQFLIFHVYPDVISGTGIILIGGATIVALVVKWREAKETVVQQNNDPDTKEKDATTQTELTFDNPAVDYQI